MTWNYRSIYTTPPAGLLPGALTRLCVLDRCVAALTAHCDYHQPDYYRTITWRPDTTLCSRSVCSGTDSPLRLPPAGLLPDYYRTIAGLLPGALTRLRVLDRCVAALTAHCDYHQPDYYRTITGLLPGALTRLRVLDRCVASLTAHCDYHRPDYYRTITWRPDTTPCSRSVW